MNKVVPEGQLTDAAMEMAGELLARSLHSCGKVKQSRCNCLGCFAEPLKSLKEMHRVLNPGGRAVLSIDYYPTEEKARKAEQWWVLPTWTEAEVREMIDNAGFSQLSVSHDKRLMFAKAIKQ